MSRENRLMVFISSLIGELADERYAAKEALETIPLTRPWVFEYTPASTDPLVESYLGKVRECDLFILLLGQNITDPVRKEWQTAVAASKPRLVFLKKGERNAEARAFVKTIDVKWAEFASTDELKRQIQEAVTDELIRSYRRYRLQPRALGPLGEFLERLGQSGRVVKVDKRSKGVYFEGKGPIHIEGDVVGGDQTKTSHETHFYSPVTGPVHTGSGDIHVGSMQVNSETSVENLLAALRQAVAAQAPPAVQSKASQQVSWLAEAITEGEPDLGLIESVLGWFQKHLPSLVGAVVAIIFHPAVIRTTEAAGKPAVTEFQQRFGRLSEQKGVING